ncbi:MULTISPECIES: SymE family type I addiction module toxin [Sphingobacterium]|uniref:SymE family type I addiction module toxin n=1 Tax=Sphingobacterium populi TaxID=1812824 RepID=A0ABW5UAG3_9SPHI
MKPTRKLKIHCKFRSRRWDNIAVPEIRLEGKWLEEAGFKPGEHVIVCVRKNRLTIILDNTRIK